MGLLQDFGKGTGYLKAGLLGFAGSGKTFTAKELAIGVRDFFKLKGPIAMVDTEAGSEYIAASIKNKTGKELRGVRSRSFDDLIAVAHECEKEKVSVLIVDSITHIWRDLVASYLNAINERRVKKSLSIRRNLTLKDWSPLKDHWNDKWTSWYMNSAMHVIICGRAGYEYAFTEDEETEKKEITKTGIKMKTESEFGFEPSLLVEMELIQLAKTKDPRQVTHRATVLKDRFSIIDGHSCDNPTLDFFMPHLKLLTPGVVSAVDTTAKSDVPIDDDSWPKEKREREILCEEIQGAIASTYPGQTAKEKKAKADLVYKYFKTRSWTKVESMQAETLRPALAALRDELATVVVAEVAS